MAPKGIQNEELQKVRQRELEIKRISGTVSCYDCRRLKLKCDKKIPCSSCIRRGASTYCPIGRKSASPEVRDGESSDAVSMTFQLEQAKKKLAIMSERIRLLEDALFAAGDSTTSPNSLLTDDLLRVKDDLDLTVMPERRPHREEDDTVTKAFGTLSISGDSGQRYYGGTAGDAVLLATEVEPTVSERIGDPYITPAVREISHNWPFSAGNPTESRIHMAQLVAHLPPIERSTALAESFFGNISWLHCPVERAQVVSEIMPVLYPNRRPVSPDAANPDHAHLLALLFSVFACGAAGDFTQSTMNVEGERFYHLTKAALCVNNIMRDTTLEAVQATMLLGLYNLFSARAPSIDETWNVCSLACTLAISIGLHRDPSHWGLDPVMVNRRRRTFWNMHISDSFKSLTVGRPNSFPAGYFDCELPTDCLAILEDDGTVTESVYNWRYRFSRDVLSEVCRRLCASSSLRYSDILDLDRLVRGFKVHPGVEKPKIPHEDLGRNVDWHRLVPLVTLWDKEETLLYVHRNYFARAVLDFPDNPLRSPFSISFLATYRSSAALLRIIVTNFDMVYNQVLRAWSVWTLLLSSAVVMAVVASLGSSVKFAYAAFIELEKAILVFENSTEHIVARHGLPLLKRLREKAAQALRKEKPSDSNQGNVLALPSQNEMQAELEALRGSTRLIRQQKAARAQASKGEIYYSEHPQLATAPPIVSQIESVNSHTEFLSAPSMDSHQSQRPTGRGPVAPGHSNHEGYASGIDNNAFHQENWFASFNNAPGFFAAKPEAHFSTPQDPEDDMWNAFGVLPPHDIPISATPTNQIHDQSSSFDPSTMSIENWDSTAWQTLMDEVGVNIPLSHELPIREHHGQTGTESIPLL